MALVVTNDFQESDLFNTHLVPQLNASNFRQIQADANTFARLDTSECIAEYSTPLVGGRSNVVLVSNYTSHNSRTNSSVLFANYFDPSISTVPYSVFYGGGDHATDFPHVQQNGTFQYRIDDNRTHFATAEILYCLSKEITDVCSLQLHTPSLIVVIVANILKIACFMFILFCLPRLSPLITVGDAIASFLESPDLTTAGSRTLSRDVVEKFDRQNQKAMHDKQNIYTPLRRRPFSKLQHHWPKSVSTRQRIITFFS